MIRWNRDRSPRAGAPGGARPWVVRLLLATAATLATGGLVSAADLEGVATVDGTSLQRWELDRELAISIAQGSFHRTVPEERVAELECEALRRLVLKQLKSSWAQRQGIGIEPTVVASSWQEVRDRFASDDQYRAALAAKGISDADLRTAIRRDVAAAAAEAAVAGETATPTELEIEVYFTLYRDRFISPEARHVVHALVHVPASSGPEAWNDAERRARELVRQAADGGMDLIDLVPTLRKLLPPRLHDQVGDLGFVHRGSLLPAVDEAVFAAAPGSITEPVRSIYGFHILQIVDVRPPRPLDLAEVRDAVAATLVADARRRRIESFERELLEGAVIEGGECAGTS